MLPGAPATVHGAWLAAELARHGHQVSPGTLYPTLHRMEEGGLLRAFGFHRAVDSAVAVVGPLIGLVLYHAFGRQLRPLFLVAVIPAPDTRDRPLRCCTPSGRIRRRSASNAACIASRAHLQSLGTIADLRLRGATI